MTESMTETRHETPQPGRCRVGSRTSRPCWREAYAPIDATWTSGPWVCREHRTAADLGREADEMLYGLESLQAWIVAEQIGPRAQTHLMDAAYRAREELEALYLEARIKADAAALVADRREDEDPITLEDAERGRRRLTLSDALGNARSTLEDVSADALPPGLDRFLTCAALDALAHERRASTEPTA